MCISKFDDAQEYRIGLDCFVGTAADCPLQVHAGKSAIRGPR
jgi:hypothetical protein